MAFPVLNGLHLFTTSIKEPPNVDGRASKPSRMDDDPGSHAITTVRNALEEGLNHLAKTC